MQQIGFPSTNTGPQNVGQQNSATQNPPQQPQTVPQQAHVVNNSTASFSGAGFQVVPFVLVPAYIMAYPQMMAGAPVNAQGGVNSGAVPDAPTQGVHVTSNPTNSLSSPGGNSFGGSSFGSYGMSGFAMGGFAMPVMMSPVLLQMGFPIYAPTQASTHQPSQPNPVLDAPPSVPAVDADPITVPDPIVRPVVNTDRDVIDVVPNTEHTTNFPTLPIAQLSATDFADYRLIEKSKQQETSLVLELMTQDGDVITLDFNQLDSMEMSRFGGNTLDGQNVKDYSFREATERVVTMQVSGDISSEEQAAIDEVLSTIVSVVQSFFTGEVGDAIDKLKSMDFDAQQLSSLALNMSMTKSASVTKAYHDGADGQLHDVAQNDASVDQALDFLATEQKRLIDLAKSVLDAPSSANLIRSLVPPLLSEPFADLRKEIIASQQVQEPDEVDETEAAS